MKLPFFGDYFSHLSADVIIVQKLNLIIKGIDNMATKLDVLNAISALEVRVATGLTVATAGLTAQITDLKSQLASGTAVSDANLNDILAAINGIALTTTPAPV